MSIILITYIKQILLSSIEKTNTRSFIFMPI